MHRFDAIKRVLIIDYKEINSQKGKMAKNDKKRVTEMLLVVKLENSI
jgi:hypothetical protein